MPVKTRISSLMTSTQGLTPLFFTGISLLLQGLSKLASDLFISAFRLMFLAMISNCKGLKNRLNMPYASRGETPSNLTCSRCEAIDKGINDGTDDGMGILLIRGSIDKVEEVIL